MTSGDKNRDSRALSRFDRNALEVVGPSRVKSKGGLEQVQYDLTRHMDSARVDLTYMRVNGREWKHEVCSAKLDGVWAGADYEGCIFLAHRRIWEEQSDDSVDRDLSHWYIDWHSPDHAARARDLSTVNRRSRRTPTTWPGHFHSCREATLESLMLSLLDEIAGGIWLIEESRAELNRTAGVE